MPKQPIKQLLDEIHETQQPTRWNILHFESCHHYFLIGIANRFASLSFLKDRFTYTRTFHLLAISSFREDKGLHLVWFPNWGIQSGGRSLLAIYSNEGDLTISIFFIRIAFC